ncbi:hypothetical protein POM88_017153 [Heracleum sosnowskyi]|uniref:Protein kinase domain-containing protein n=1 Tax=Heracleum sosnowskyi TaxID=360622 RepID=A0AAD8IS15_9APIA|nr:hypothetical protein POM88_017153 [Heracleum sosnowskyi]
MTLVRSAENLNLEKKLREKGRDNISADNWIYDNGQGIVSAGNFFRLGFFTPNGNITQDRRYIGIWYCNSPEVIVWVANQEVAILSNVSRAFGETLWESFKHTTDTFLPGMKMDENLNLTSWMSDEDPAPGNFSFRLDGKVGGGYSIMKFGLKPYWRSGGESANSFIPLKMSTSAALLLSGSTNNTSKQASSSRLLMQSNGEIQYLSWDSGKMRWLLLRSGPRGRLVDVNQTLLIIICHSARVCLDSEYFSSPPSAGNQLRSRKHPTSRGVTISISVILSVTLLCIITFISCRRLVAKRKDRNIEQYPALQFYDNNDSMGQDNHFREDGEKDLGVPFFELESIVAATHNFSQAYKLGEGGFGPVYKGKLPGGEEIAVKRISSSSGQGLMEFKNKVLLIAKLQHRNLVRLLGYCMKGNEKILLYEYMSNKSLDAFIFDTKLSMLLNWKTRFDIILGVARVVIWLQNNRKGRPSQIYASYNIVC